MVADAATQVAPSMVTEVATEVVTEGYVPQVGKGLKSGGLAEGLVEQLLALRTQLPSFARVISEGLLHGPRKTLVSGSTSGQVSAGRPVCP